MDNGIPTDVLSKGGLNSGGINGSTVITPFVTIMNDVIAVLAVIFLAYAVFHLVLHAKDLTSGKKDIHSVRGSFINIGIALVILMLSLTKGWYPLLNWIYTNIISPILGQFH
ncbi:hypothetical protein GFC01_06045 [Desulfofundulus thermobenzoicus]|uniref:Uncharacterized protein n=1 Tax=Desulfofundulus thermobenzoicus TaxID=29376 RepID=A0A6N7IPJ5_9FIRM|nr:hypothetical protein [Desulfofundulus thermobenzoicus]MQL51831.1 hypothetical protein [Desulfofundulus thermobenzoicus]